MGPETQLPAAVLLSQATSASPPETPAVRGSQGSTFWCHFRWKKEDFFTEKVPEEIKCQKDLNEGSVSSLDFSGHHDEY
jgi:hypothetical protein